MREVINMSISLSRSACGSSGFHDEIVATVLVWMCVCVCVCGKKQHVEITRDLAGKFNNTYGETFKLPKEIVVAEVETVPGIDGQKMSKSYGNTIPLFASDDEIRALVAKIPTDSKAVEEAKNPDENNIYNIHKLFLSA